MAEFAQSLRSYRLGSLTREELFSEVYRQLTVEKTSPTALLDILRFQQQAEPLPAELHDALFARLSNWPQDPTVASGDADEATERPAPVVVGDVIQGRFSIVALIGAGGMSYVYKAVDLRKVETGAANPFVAIKVLTAPLSDYYGSLAALQREAHKLQSLNHPNIVRVIDCDRDGQIVFMTMEYLSGESVQRRLRSAKDGLPDAATVVLKIAEALRYAHANDILHGDLKPGNVILTDDGEVKVIDFGMARFMTRADALSAGSNGALAVDPPGAVTPRYASPQLLGGHRPEASDDVFALGCVAYEVMTGRHPFGRSTDPKQRDVGVAPPRPPGMGIGGGGARYRALVHAVQAEKGRRTPSVQRFIDEFSGALHRRRVGWGLAAGVLSAIMLIVMLTHGIGLRAVGGPGLGRKAVAAAPRAEVVMHDCATCPAMTVIPPGSFMQGDSDKQPATGADFAKPVHMVHIKQQFAMSSNEVTVGEYRAFVDATQRETSACNVYDGQWQIKENASWREPGFAQTDSHPAVCVSWNDAQAYTEWLSAQTGHRYRLPSASEWEYAARAGSPEATPWGRDAGQACASANVADRSAAQRYPGWNTFGCSDGFVGTAPVGSFKPNAFGLNDMFGNAFEWVADCWRDDYADAPPDGAARLGGDCGEHELRGGSWFSAPGFVNAWYRNRFPAEYRSSSVGFRVLRVLP